MSKIRKKKTSASTLSLSFGICSRETRCDLNYSSVIVSFFLFNSNDWCNWSIRASPLFPGRACEFNRVAECNSARCSHWFASAPPENCSRRDSLFSSSPRCCVASMAGWEDEKKENHETSCRKLKYRLRFLRYAYRGIPRRNGEIYTRINATEYRSL